MAKYGFAKVDITPVQPMYLVGFASRDRLSEGVLDPLHIRAMAVVGESTSVIWIELELLFAYEDIATEIRERIAAKYRLPAQNIVVAAIHTHSGPGRHSSKLGEPEAVYEAYYARVVDKACSCAASAMDGAVECEVDLTLTVTDVNMCRREWRDNRVVLGENPAGIWDRSTRALRFRAGDEIIGMFVRSSIHPVCLHPTHYVVSSDCVGRAARLLEEKYPDLTAIYANGTPGDIKVRRPKGLDDRANLDKQGAKYFAELSAILDQPFVPIEQDTNPIAMEISYDIPLEPYTAADRAAQRAKVGAEMLPYYDKWAQNSIAMLASGAKLSMPVKLQALRLPCGVYLFTLPFEPVSAVQFVTQDALLDGFGVPPENVWVMGYANASNGYLVSEKELNEGGYEPHESAWYGSRPSYFAKTALKGVAMQCVDLYKDLSSAALER